MTIRVPDFYQLIPDEAFLYLPQQDDMLTHSGKQRLIFEGEVDVSKTQREKLNEFHKYLVTKAITLDDYWSEGKRLKLLQANVFNFEKTITDMDRYYQWVKTSHPLQLNNQIQSQLKQGLIYICGRDSKYRPIVVFDAKKSLDAKLPPDIGVQLLSYFFQYVIDNMMIEGQVQNWTLLIDIGGSGITSHVDLMKKVATALSSRFHNRMGRCYILKASATFNFIWMIAKQFLYEDTLKKVSFTSSNTLKEIFEDCNPSQIEEKYGGTLPNITKFWPIQVSKAPYQAFGKASKVISKQKYYQLYSNKKLKSRKINKKIIDMFKSSENIQNQAPFSRLSYVQEVTTPIQKIENVLQRFPSILKISSEQELATKYQQTNRMTFYANQKQRSSVSITTGIGSSRSIINVQGEINPVIHFQLNNCKPRSFKI